MLCPPHLLFPLLLTNLLAPLPLTPPPSIRVDIIDNFERASDPEFTSWLRTKSETSTDVDEREALRSLLDTIEETVRMIELKQMQEEREGKERAEVEAAQRKEVRGMRRVRGVAAVLSTFYANHPSHPSLSYRSRRRRGGERT